MSNGTARVLLAVQANEDTKCRQEEIDVAVLADLAELLGEASCACLLLKKLIYPAFPRTIFISANFLEEHECHYVDCTSDTIDFILVGTTYIVHHVRIDHILIMTS